MAPDPREARRPMQVALLLLAAVVGVGLLVLAAHQSAARRKELAAFAASQGLSFAPDRDPDFERRVPPFPALCRGDRRYAFNVVAGHHQQRAVRCFDYHYQTYSHGKHGRRTHHHHFSAVLVECDLPLRPLVLRAENVLDKLAELVGFDDIDFESSEFSRRFHVKAEDRRWAFDLLHQATMEFLLARPVFALDFRPGAVLAWRDTQLAVADLSAALDVVHGVLDRLPPSVVQELRAGG